IALPSSRNWTPTTPTLSEAPAATVTGPLTVAPAAGAVTVTAGGVVSFDTVTVAAAEVVLFPATSRATAVSLWLPLPTAVLSQVTENGEVVSSAPSGVPSNWNCTPTTPTLSEAEAATDTDPDTVAPSAGAVSDTAGGVVSAFATVTLTLAAVAVFPAASRATA